MTLFDKQLEAYNSLNNFKIIQYGGDCLKTHSSQNVS